MISQGDVIVMLLFHKTYMRVFLHGRASECIWQIVGVCAHPKGVKPVHRAPTGHSHTGGQKDTQPYMTTHPDPFPSALIRSNSTMLQLSIYSFPSLSLCLYDPLFLAQPLAVNWEVRKDLIAQRMLSPPSLVILCSLKSLKYEHGAAKQKYG